jgi:hypothetical protein
MPWKLNGCSTIILDGGQSFRNRIKGRFRELTRTSSDFRIFLTLFRWLLWLGVLRLRSDEDRNIRVGILPEREEILLGRLGLCGVALYCIGTSQSQSGQCTQPITAVEAAAAVASSAARIIKYHPSAISKESSAIATLDGSISSRAEALKKPS